MTDSIIHTIDTPAWADTLSRIEAFPLTDSISSQSVTQQTHPGFDGLLRKSFATNEAWVFIVLLLLSFMLIFALIRSEGIIWERFKAFFSRKKKLDSFQASNIESSTYLVLIRSFTLAVLALMSYEIIYLGIYPFRFLTFIYIIGIFFAYFTFKHLLFTIVGNTFWNSKSTKNFIRLYSNLVYVSAVFIFPLLILNTYQPQSWQIYILTIVACIQLFFYILLIIKIFHVFYIKPLALFYIFLYLCTLEILPILILFRAAERLIIYV